MSDSEARNINIPKLGMQMVEAGLTEWLVEDGSPCHEGQPLALIETEKIEHEIEAPADGYLRIIVPAGGDDIEVGTLIGVVVDSPDAPLP